VQRLRDRRRRRRARDRVVPDAARDGRSPRGRHPRRVTPRFLDWKWRGSSLASPKRARVRGTGGIDSVRRGGALEAVHVHRLKALGALLDLELDRLVLEQAPTPLPVDLRVVNEDVRAGLLLDETPALLVVEPLYLADCHVSSTSSLVDTRDLSARRPAFHK